MGEPFVLLFITHSFLFVSEKMIDDEFDPAAQRWSHRTLTNEPITPRILAKSKSLLDFRRTDNSHGWGVLTQDEEAQLVTRMWSEFADEKLPARSLVWLTAKRTAPATLSIEGLPFQYEVAADVTARVRNMTYVLDKLNDAATPTPQLIAYMREELTVLKYLYAFSHGKLPQLARRLLNGCICDATVWFEENHIEAFTEDAARELLKPNTTVESTGSVLRLRKRPRY